MDYSTKSELIGELKKAMKDPENEAELEDDRVNFKNTTGTLEIHEEQSLDESVNLNQEKDENKELEEIMARLVAQRQKK